MTDRRSSERGLWIGVARRALWVAIVLTSACREAPARTQTVLWINAARSVRAATDRVHVQVESVGSGQQRLDQDVVPDWPVKLVILPLGADANRKYRVRFSALDDHAQPQVSLSVVSGFVDKQSRFARLTLQPNCLGATELAISVPVERLSTRESAPYEIPTACPGDTPEDPTADAGSVHADAGASSRDPDSDAGSEPMCATGYAASGDHCEDIDECAQPARCTGNATCQNVPGTFHCTCETGYAYQDFSCVNQNECALNNGGCQQRCTDLEGSFACSCDQDALLLPDKTSCAHWRSTVMIAGDTSEVMYTPAIATDAQGNALAVWRQNCNQQNCIWANHFAAGSGWSSALQITDDLGDYLTSPSVSFSATGNARVGWMHSLSGRFAMYTRRFVPPDTWEAQTTINVLGADVSGGVVQLGRDDALAVWKQTESAGSTLWTRRFVDAAWQPAVLVESNPADSLAPVGLTAAADGGVLAVWQRTQPGVTGVDLWANRWSPSAAWVGHVKIATVLSDNLEVHLAGSRDGSAMLLWVGPDGLWSSRFVAKSGWGPAQRVAPDRSNVWTGQLTMDPHGNAIAVWWQYEMSPNNEVGSAIWGSHYAVDSGWSPAVLLSPRKAAQTSEVSVPCLAMDPFDNGVVVWSQSDGTRSRIWRAHYVAGTGWYGDAAMLDSPDAGNDVSPAVAMDALGHAIVVWNQATDARHVVLASRFE
jgi:hypothetical protein